MAELISDAIDKNEYSIGLFLDLRKAFDTNDHYIWVLGIIIDEKLNWKEQILNIENNVSKILDSCIGGKVD